MYLPQCRLVRHSIAATQYNLRRPGPVRDSAVAQGNPNSMPDAALHSKSNASQFRVRVDPPDTAQVYYAAPMTNTVVNPTYRGWLKLPANALGAKVFSAAMCVRVPYFATVLPTVRVLEPGRCEVTGPKWWGVHNHLGTYHAIAACNLAETAMGMLCEATVPNTHRWIPKAMSVEYVTKANSGLRAMALLDELPDFTAITEGAELVVPISVVDKAGVEVVRARITTWVTPKS